MFYRWNIWNALSKRARLNIVAIYVRTLILWTWQHKRIKKIQHLTGFQKQGVIWLIFEFIQAL